MADRPGWYPPGQISYPPEIPAYLKNVEDLQPIIGVPSDDEIIKINNIVHAANRVSCGMHDPDLSMKLADHLFNAQMARYRSRHSLIKFPGDATYTPPTLPSHISVNLERISGTPSDEELMRVQDAVQSYQGLRSYPSIFDAHVNMELSQHLFDIQMARYMRRAGENQPRSVFQVTERFGFSVHEELNTAKTKETTSMTSIAEVGRDATGVSQSLRPSSGIDVCELIGRSNQLAEKLNQLLERSNELAERGNKANNTPDPLAERFNQVLERFTQFVDQTSQPSEQSNRLAERSAPQNNTPVELTSATHRVEPTNQDIDISTNKAGRAVDAEATQATLELTIRDALERSNQLSELSNQLIERSNQIAEQLTRVVEESNQPREQSNAITEKVTNLFERMDRHFERSDRLAEASMKPVEKLGHILKNISKVLVGIQHAIVRGHRENTSSTLDFLVNEKGDSHLQNTVTFSSLSELYSHDSKSHLPLTVDGVTANCYIPDRWLGACLHFFGIGSDFRENEEAARKVLSRYLSSCFSG